MAWQSRPVFVSSTFADMQAERDHLRTRVFPALEERLNTRRRHLEWVDLRLGVANASLEEGQQRELHVLKVCLAEVKRCRPFLIVLLGDRYGWVPPAERIERAAREEGFEGEVAGRSVTDLEISFGVLGDPEQQPRSFFYFREPLPYADMPPELAGLYADFHNDDTGAADRSVRLAALKREIETRLPGRVRHYEADWDSEHHRVTGLEAWGRSVIEDVWAELEVETGAISVEEEISWQQAERNALDDYAEDRARDFVGRDTVLTRLEELAASPAQQGATWGLCLTGASGSGKSAVFGELHRRLKQSNTFVLAHAAGASTRAQSVEDMLRRWIEELGVALDVDPCIASNTDPDTIETTFHSLLGRLAAQRRAVVLVDALDLFEATTRGRFVTWLQRVWPANARLIAMAVPGDASRALAARSGLETLPLPPFDVTEARNLTQAICDRYHRKLEPEVMDALLAKPGENGPPCGNALWLVLAVEELNLVDADDFTRARQTYAGPPAEQIRALMLDRVAELPSDIGGLYRSSFDRAGELFGALFTRNFIGIIAISRAGWRETDFRSLLPRLSGEAWDELKFASLRRLFRGQLKQRGVSAQWDFAHAQMRPAARYYISSLNLSERELHAEAAKHMLELPRKDLLRQTEAMVHLVGSEDWNTAARFYGDPELTAPELTGATQVLAGDLLADETAPTGLKHVHFLLNALSGDPLAVSTAGLAAERLLFVSLDEMLRGRASLQVRAEFHRSVERTFDQLANADPGNAGWQLDLGISRERIGDDLMAQGNLAGALECYQAGDDIVAHLLNTNPGNAGWQHALSVSQERIGDVFCAQGNLSAALEAYGISLAIADQLAKTDPGNAEWQRDLSAAYIKIGDVLQAQGNLQGSLEAYRASSAIIDRLANAYPGDAQWQRNLSVTQEKVGGVLLARGDQASALEAYGSSLAIRERLAKADPGNAGRQSDLSVSLEKIADVLCAQGNLPAALDVYRASLAIADQLAKTDPANAEWQGDLSILFNKIGRVLIEVGDLSSALEACRASLAIKGCLVEADPGNAEWQHGLSVSQERIGDVFLEQGELLAALEAYRASLEIRDTLAKADPSNVLWQYDVALSLQRIGLVAAQESQPNESLAAYRRGHEVMGRLIQLAPDNAGFNRVLAWFEARLAELLEK